MHCTQHPGVPSPPWWGTSVRPPGPHVFCMHAQAIEAMAALKAQWDPRGILNPYKLLPKAALEAAYAAMEP